MEKGWVAMITRFGWNVFQQTGSIEAYLLYRHCQSMHEHTSAVSCDYEQKVVAK